MRTNKSLEIAAGGIITSYNEKTKSIDVLLALSKSYGGYWGFPKGHVELNETLIETAIREIKEETNLDVVLVDPNLFWLSKYIPFENVQKEVTYFWFKAININNLKLQETEIEKLVWIDYKEVQKLLTYNNDKTIFNNFLKALNLPKDLKKIKNKLIV